VDIIGVGCYSSKELWTWEKEGISLAAEKTDKSINFFMNFSRHVNDMKYGFTQKKLIFFD